MWQFFKIESIANRYALKDLFDLSYISEKISLEKLLNSYNEKKEWYLKAGIKTIFHYDNKVCPFKDPISLIDNKTGDPHLPFHSQPNLIRGVDRKVIIYHISNWKIKVKSEVKRRIST